MRVEGNVVWLAVAVLLLAGASQLPDGSSEATHADVGSAAGAPTETTAATTHHVIALDVVAYACSTTDDGVCLGYDGVTPADPIVVHERDTLEVTITNRIGETLTGLDVDLDDDTREQLNSAGVSFHTHGTILPVTSDGVQAVPGTQMVDSFATPGGTYTYEFEARYAGAWHFHDHVMGPDGADGVERGLFGSLFVLPSDEATDHVLDLHLLDDGPNAGHGFEATVVAGERFDLSVVGLGNHWWDVTLTGPSGTAIETVEVGPGVSLGMTVAPAIAGTYTWTAASGFTGDTYTGSIEVVQE